MKLNYYKILGVSPDAADKEIRRVYYKLAQRYHPDKAQNRDESRKFEENFALITEAYNCLKDPVRRKEYDKTIQRKPDESEAKAPSPKAEQSSAESSNGESATENIPKAEYQGDRTSLARRAYKKGIKHFNSGDFKRAVEFLDVAAQNDSQNARYLSLLALSLVRSHQRIAQAIDLCKQAVEIEPFNQEHRLRLGHIYRMIGSTSLAKEMYEGVLKWDSSNLEARENLREVGGLKIKPVSFFSRLLKLINRQ